MRAFTDKAGNTILRCRAPRVPAAAVYSVHLFCVGQEASDAHLTYTYHSDLTILDVQPLEVGEAPPSLRMLGKA